MAELNALDEEAFGKSYGSCLMKRLLRTNIRIAHASP